MYAANLASVLTVMPALAIEGDDFEIDTSTTDMRDADPRTVVNSIGGAEHHSEILQL